MRHQFPPKLTASSAITVGNSLFVSTIGNDNTGTRERLDKPFLTLGAAKTAASSGDTIYVAPGSYSITDSIFKNGVNWDFAPASVVTYTNNGAKYGPLDDKGEAITCKVTGCADFIRAESAAGSMGETPYALSTSNAASNVYVEGNSIAFNYTGLTGTSPYTVWGEAGTLKFRFNKVSATSSSGSSSVAIAWLNGPMYGTVAEVISDNHGVVTKCNDAPTGDCFLDIQLIDTTSAAVSTSERGVRNLGTNTSAAIWIRVAVIKTAGNAGTCRAVLADSGTGNKVYITAQKIFGHVEHAGSGLLYIETDKWEANCNAGTNNGLFTKVTAGTVRLTCRHYDGAAISNACGWRLTGGTLIINGGDFTASSTGGGLSATGGTMLVKDLTLDTSANSSRNAVVVSGGTLNLFECSAIGHASQNDLSQSGGTLNVRGGSGSGTGGLYTTSGTITRLVG